MQALVALINEWLAMDAERNQSELARLSGIAPHVIGRWLNGQVDHVSPKNLRLVAPVLGLSYEDLLRRMGELPSLESRVEIDPRRLARHAELDRLLGAVVPEHEEYVWHSTVDLIRQLGTAVNAAVGRSHPSATRRDRSPADATVRSARAVANRHASGGAGRDNGTLPRVPAWC